MNRPIWIVVLAATAAMVGAIVGVSVLSARQPLQAGAPGVMNYQGYLENSSGQPISGTVTLRFRIYDAPSGGTNVWDETQAGVSVSNGFFNVLLGSVTPLTAAIFDSTTRYIQVSVDTGSGFTDLPRQRLGSVPYAFQAEVAKSVPYTGITGMPTSSGPQNIIIVAKSGGDYTSVYSATQSITNASANNRYLVYVAPGVYTETNLITVNAYVHLQGAGPNVSVITGTRSAATPGNLDSAMVNVLDNARLSDIGVNNGSTTALAIGIYSVNATRATIIENVRVEVRGAGGTGHTGMYINESEPFIKNSYFKAGGASAGNTAVTVINAAAGFPQPFIKDSVLLGGENNNEYTCADSTGTGIGLYLIEGSPEVMQSIICGGHRAVVVSLNGNPRIHGSIAKVSGSAGAFLVEVTASGGVGFATSQLFYFANLFTGAGAPPFCTQSYLANFTAANPACS